MTSARPTLRAVAAPTRQAQQGPRWVVPLKERRLNLVRVASSLAFFSKVTFVLFVLLPAIAGGYYYGAVASDQYETETRLVVRTIGLQMSDDQGAGQVSTLGGAAMVQDAHILVNYLKSEDVVQDLQEDLDLRALFSNDKIDILSRLVDDASIEELHNHWRRHTLAYVDGPSGIIQFSVRAFSPDDAVTISNAAITRAAGLIEVMSQDAKIALLDRAKVELDKAQALYVASLNDLRDLQNQAGILNPFAEAGVSTETIGTLFLEKLRAEAEVGRLAASGVEGSPIVTQLRNKIQILEGQIVAQREQMAGLQDQSGQLTDFFSRITALETDRLLAESLYRSASRNYDLARSTTERRSTFVSVFSPPIKPTLPSYPERFGLWMILATCLLAAWATLVLVLAAINDHRS